MNDLVQRLRQKVRPCHFREYEPEDRAACVAIYRSNEPDFVKPEYFPAFERLLEEGTSYMLVLEHGGRIVGFGALELRGEQDVATLRFGMIHREWRGRGLGSALLAVRLALLAPDGDTMTVGLETGAASAAFFGSYGFELVSIGEATVHTEPEIGRLGLSMPALWLEEIGQVVEERGITVALRDEPMIDPGEGLPEGFD